jgi:hypothetical protein
MIKQPIAIERRTVLRNGVVAGLGLLSASCGWILYPERKGRSSGNIDLAVLIVDLLWLLPGIVPGAICLAVDFTTGCIYRGGASVGARPFNDSLPDERPELAEVHLDGKVVAKSIGGADSNGQFDLYWQPGVDIAAVKARGTLVMKRARGATATAPVLDLV